jgi:hypothetical protein
MNPTVLDFEYREVQPGRLEVLCVVAQHLGSGRVDRQWLGGVASPSPAFPLDTDTMIVAHAVAPAEARCLLALGWKFPGGWIDTYAEERVLAKGGKPDEGFSLLACCRRRGIQVMADFEKADMRALCLRPGDHTADEQRRILDYCQADVVANAALFAAICDRLNVPQALLRGRYLAECARISGRGLPVDPLRFQRVKELGNDGLRQLFGKHFDECGILRHGSLDRKKFAALVASQGIPWPLTETEMLETGKDTLKEMERTHGGLWVGVRQLLGSVRGAGVDALQVGPDGRLIAELRPFGSITGRCTPSSSEFLWNGPKWQRFLLQPPPGRTVLVIDWSNQEFAIAAALSEDAAMMAAYESGDPYLALAVQAGRVPAGATKESHGLEREQIKVVSLGVLMGMGACGIAGRLGTNLSRAEDLLATHRRIYRRFWEWSDATVSTAAANRPLETAFGLVYQPGVESKPRTARNYLLQATGSDMLRVAVLLLASKGVDVISTMHDAVMIECDTEDAGAVGRVAVECMRQASLITLWDRLEVRTEVTRVDHPNHYQDEKGREYWTRLAGLLELPLDDHGR